MPAAAVIPAPIAYIKVVAFKKLVVGSAVYDGGPPMGVTAFRGLISLVFSCCSSLSGLSGWKFYFEKIRVLKAGIWSCIMVHGIME